MKRTEEQRPIHSNRDKIRPIYSSTCEHEILSEQNTRCTFTVMSFNVMLPFSEFIKDYKQTHRIRYMARFFATLKRKHPQLSVIALCELIPTQYIQHFQSFMKKLGFPYFASVKSPILQQNGGLCTFSAEPIKDFQFVGFGTACMYADCLANKGVLYSRCVCRCRRHDIHLFSTHMQSWSSLLAEGIRTEQLQIISKFIDNTVHFKGRHTNEPVILCGDFNMDAHMVTELQKINKLLRMQFPHVGRHSLTNTFDRTNTMVGLDGSWENGTAEYPRGCFDEFKSSGVCVCCPNQWLDYILHRPNSRLDHVTQQVVSCDVYGWQQHGRRQPVFVSDHYPVLCTFTYRVPSSPIHKTPHTRRHNTTKSCVIM